MSEMDRHLSIYQQIDTAVHPAGPIDKICSSFAAFVLPELCCLVPLVTLPRAISMIGPMIGVSIFACDLNFCREVLMSDDADEGITVQTLGWYRTSKVACLALSRYAEMRTSHYLLGLTISSSIPTNDQE